MEAPEKIWINPSIDLPKLNGVIDKNSVQYIRKDFFIKKAEEFIKAKTRIGSNTTKGWRRNGVSIPSYSLPWLTPDQARKAMEIAREETIKDVCEWLDNHTMLSEKWYIEDLKKHLEDKL